MPFKNDVSNRIIESSELVNHIGNSLKLQNYEINLGSFIPFGIGCLGELFLASLASIVKIHICKN